MESKIIEVDFLKKEEGEKPSDKPVFFKEETLEQKLLRLEILVAQGLYEPDMEDVAGVLIDKLVVEEKKMTKK